MNAIPRGACAAAVALALACAHTARAQTFYTTNTTIQSDVTGDVVIGRSSYSAGATSTSPNVVLGSQVNISHDVQVFNASTFYTTGNIDGDLSGYDDSIITVAPGAKLAYALFADNHSTVNINGGTFSNVIDAFNSSTLNVRGGSFSTIVAFENSVINLFGDVHATLNNPSFGYQGAYTQYALSGTLGNTFIAPDTFLNIVNGSGVKVFFYAAGTGPSSTLVPEPGSVGMLLGLGVTGAGFAARRRRQRA